MESAQEGSVSKENLPSLETPKTAGRERKTLHRSQSVITFSSSSNASKKVSVRKGELTSQEDAKDELKPRKAIHRTKSYNGEELTVKNEKEKKKNKSPITKTSLKVHLSQKKKLERRDSEKKLSLSVSEEMSDYSSSEISTSDKPLEDLFKQDGKQDHNLKHLKRLLDKKDLIKASQLKLNRSAVVRALRELGPKGRNIITWNLETSGNKNNNIIRGDIIRTPENLAFDKLPTLNIHLHSRKGKWYEDENIKNHFLTFIRACDPSVNKLIEEIEGSVENK
jgi:hypothetical protein